MAIFPAEAAVPAQLRAGARLARNNYERKHECRTGNDLSRDRHSLAFRLKHCHYPMSAVAHPLLIVVAPLAAGKNTAQGRREVVHCLLSARSWPFDVSDVRKIPRISCGPLSTAALGRNARSCARGAFSGTERAPDKRECAASFVCISQPASEIIWKLSCARPRMFYQCKSNATRGETSLADRIVCVENKRNMKSVIRRPRRAWIHGVHRGKYPKGSRSRYKPPIALVQKRAYSCRF